jgi:alkaline phosphatase D
MEDWVLKNGRACNTHSGGDRNLALLTAEVTDAPGTLLLEADFEPIGKGGGEGFIGFQMGLQGNFNDYRDSAISGTGFAAGIGQDGRFFIGSHRSDEPLLAPHHGSLRLSLSARPMADGLYALELAATSLAEGGEARRFVNEGVHPSWLPGLVAFTVSSQAPVSTLIRQPRPGRVAGIAQQRGGDWRYAISRISLTGSKIVAHPERAFGPVLWTQHSVNDGTLVLTAQFMPVDSPEEARLEIRGEVVGTAAIDPKARLARFVVRNFNASTPAAYRVRWRESSYAGTLAAIPIERDSLRVAALSCNDATGFPHNPLVQNVSDQNPDLIAFLGDQIYEPVGGYGHHLGPADNTIYDDRASLCYLRKYYMHGWSWGSLLSRIPSIILPADHDVLHGNLWGQGGKLADRATDSGASAQDSGGYKLSAGSVNAVHLTQTGNLPAPSDAEPSLNGITVYFTRWSYAGIDMAILSDRQFKSAPKAQLPEAKISNGWPQNQAYQFPNLRDARVFDVEGASLLGARQEKFLAAWAGTRAPNSRWRLVFSQSPFASAHTLPTNAFSDNVVPNLPVLQPGEYPPDDIVKVDFDGNGWPQSRRDFAVREITRAGALHIAGDQHLGMTGQYGLEAHDAGAWWIATPAIANIWPRRWFPSSVGKSRREGDPKYTGQFLDGFHNRITVHAVSNPFATGREPARLHDRSVGYSLITLDRKTGHITMENWPYTAGPNAKDKKPYPGWPITINPATHTRID